MSLILDALRKAEAERQRGAVPGLHDLGLAPARPPAPPRRPAAPSLLLGAALLVLAGLAAWVWLGRGPATAGVAGSTGTDPAAPATAAPPVAPALPLVVSAPPSAAPPPAAAQAPGPAPAPADAPAPGAPPAVAPAVAPAAAPGAARPAPAPILTQVRRLADLPPEQRRELPPLQVSGSVWSEQAAARFVVLDGQVLREGDAAAPGLVLVKLAPRAATLRWRDSLIEVPF